MVVEMAIFEAIPGKEAALAAGISAGVKVIRQSPGCLNIRVHQGHETPGRCILYIEWENLEAHMVGFRQGPLFATWRSHIAGLFVGQPQMEHYHVVARE